MLSRRAFPELRLPLCGDTLGSGLPFITPSASARGSFSCGRRPGRKLSLALRCFNDT
jgi:hypothetical protein